MLLTAASTGDTRTNTQGSVIFMRKSTPKGPSKTRPRCAGAVRTCSKRNSYPTDLPLQRLRERQNARFSDEKQMSDATLPPETKKMLRYLTCEAIRHLCKVLQKVYENYRHSVHIISTGG